MDQLKEMEKRLKEKDFLLDKKNEELKKKDEEIERLKKILSNKNKNFQININKEFIRRKFK